MMKKFHLYAGILLLFGLSVDVLGSQKVESAKKGYAPVTTYDPSRDAEKDIEKAVVEARRAGKRILLEVGGEWCVWCHALDRFFEENAELVAFREKHFIMVKINYSRENKNQKVLSRYPEIPGYPHIFVLDSEGKLLHSQGTEELEKGKSYDLNRFLAFLKRWALP